MPEGLPEERAEVRLRGCNRIAGWVGSIILGFLVLSVLASFPVTARLLTGWQHHARELLPELVSRWRKTLLPLAWLAGGVFLAQVVLGVFKAKGAAGSWKRTHIVALALLLLLGTVAAIAVSGITREIVWLNEAPTLHEKRGGDSHLSHVLYDGMRLSESIGSFKEAEGRYPETLAELQASPHYFRGERWQEGLTGSALESYVYLKPALGQTGDEKVPLLISPVVVKHGRFAVFYTDGNGRAVPTEQLDTILKEAGIGTADE